MNVSMRMGVAMAGMACALCAQQPVATLPEMVVHSPRVANQTPAGTFAMPVSALRYEPRVDLHGRNIAEGQADITVRGGIFENTGMQVGAVTLTDPQTGHYLAELPIAPALLGAPRILTGPELAHGVSNATVGAIAYGWRPARTAGHLTVAAGEDGLRRYELHQGVRNGGSGPGGVGVDVALARSTSSGAVPYGEHDFGRANVRFQITGQGTQTDVFGGYQGKRFGWPNLYTPFNSNETENLQTSLFILNHRWEHVADGHMEAAVFHRRNKDDYAFNRFAPLGPRHPFQHTTWVRGGSLAARQPVGEIAVDFRGEVAADELRSTSLVAGRYLSRTMTKLALAAGREWKAAGGALKARAGLSHDDTNRDAGAFAPSAEIAREFSSGGLRRVFVSYAKTSQMPTYTALNSSATAGLFRGNAQLGRSVSHNYELGTQGSMAGWALEGAVFHRRDLALVDWTYRRGVTARTASAVDLDVSGGEVVARRTWTSVDVALGYTVLTKTADYRGAAVDASFYALNYARHRLTAALTIRLNRELDLRLDNVVRRQADNPLRTRGGRDPLMTAAGLHWRPGAMRGLELSLHADNLWDSEYQDVPAVPPAPRQVSVAASYAW